MKDIPAHVEREAVDEIEEGAARLVDEAARGLRHVEDTLTHPHDRHEKDENLHEPEREEDWQDEEDEEEKKENARGRLLTSQRSRSSLKHRRPKIRFASGKRRDAPRHLSGQSKTQPATPTSPTPDEEETARGRDVSRSRSMDDFHGTGRGPSTSRGVRFRHAAKDSVSRLILAEGHRASSPARSIRFADQQPPSSEQSQ